MKRQGIFLLICIIIASIAFGLCAYVVDETKQVVVTRFEKVVRTETKPGLKWKLPAPIEIAIYYPRNLQNWDGKKEEIPTLEKRYIYVDAFARWKIVEPNVFFKTVRYIDTAKSRLSEIINAEVRNVITDHRLIEAVRMSSRIMDIEAGISKKEDAGQEKYAIKTGREKITQMILDRSIPQISELGIELVDVKIKRINYVEKVRQSVYDRMIEERKQMAEKLRSEGQGEAKIIRGNKEKKLKEISSGAYKAAQEIKGKADAKATEIYAKAYGVDPEFYSFIKTLEIYNETLDENSSVVLSTDSEFLKYLKGYTGKNK